MSPIALAGEGDAPGARHVAGWRPGPGSPSVVAAGQAGGGSLPGCRGQHLAARGRLDESARRLSHEELAVAQRLASEGHSVVSVAEQPGPGRAADLEACGQPVEVKSFLPLGRGRDRAPTARSVYNKLQDARGQASVVVLWARGSGLTEGQAREGIGELVAKRGTRLLSSVRVLGDGFDLSLEPGRAAERPAERPARPSHGIEIR